MNDETTLDSLIRYGLSANAPHAVSLRLVTSKRSNLFIHAHTLRRSNRDFYAPPFIAAAARNARTGAKRTRRRPVAPPTITRDARCSEARTATTRKLQGPAVCAPLGARSSAFIVVDDPPRDANSCRRKHETTDGPCHRGQRPILTPRICVLQAVLTLSGLPQLYSPFLEEKKTKRKVKKKSK